MTKDDTDEPGGASAAADWGLPRRLDGEAARLLSKPLAPGLYVIATPIGNLGDITLRALVILSQVDVIYCEDTRHSGRLLSNYGISRPLRPYHDHNATKERPQILRLLAEGKRLALISDAGTPLVSDPGYKLVRAVADAGAAVVALPGPSAVLAALASSGLPTDSFFFAGFLPPKQAARRARLSQLRPVPATLLFYESPSRLAACLADIAAVMGDREAVVARELTKLHEEIRRGAPGELAAWAAAATPKGEMVVIVGPPQIAEVSDAMIAERLGGLLDEMSLRDAAKAVAEDFEVSRGRVYDIGLGIRKAGR